MSRRTSKAPGALLGLTPASRRIFRRLTSEYSIRDSGGLEILRSGLRPLDQAQAAEAQIATTARSSWTGSISGARIPAVAMMRYPRPKPSERLADKTGLLELLAASWMAVPEDNPPAKPSRPNA